MDQKERYQKILDYIKQKGPVFPIDIANLLGSDTIIAGAILSEMASKNYIQKTSRQIGNSLLYYVKGQDDEVRRKLFETLDENEKRLVQKFESLKVISPQELEPMERYLINRLYDFIFPIVVTYKGTNTNFFKFHSVLDHEVYSLLEKRFKPLEKQEGPKKRVIKKLKPKPVRKQEIESNLREQIFQLISKMGGRVINEKVIYKNREIDFLVEMKTLGARYVFKLRNKKRITDKDVSLAFAQVMEKKLPMILLITGSLSKKAQKYREESCGDLIKVIKI